jgi:Phage-related tail protein
MIALLLGLGQAASADTNLFGPNDRIRVETEANLDENAALVKFYCTIKNAEVYVDRVYAGRAPCSAKLGPGSHYVELSAPGYYPLGTWMIAEAKTTYSLSFDLERITGFLSVAASPEDAQLSLDGLPIMSGASEQGAGRHRLVARRFGYVEKSLEIVIAPRSTTYVQIGLERAAFAIEGFGFSRSAFNPRNSGAPGQSQLEFKATSYGSGHVDIRAASGKIVRSFDFPDFQSWSQGVSWDGRDKNGEVLVDGLYTAELVAKPAEGTPLQSAGTKANGQVVAADGSVSAQAKAEIDSSIVIRSQGTAGAVPGLVHMPDTSIQPAGTIAIEASCFSSAKALSDSAFGLSAAVSLGGVATIAAEAAAELGEASSSTAKGDLAASGLVGLFGSKTSAYSGAFFLRGVYTSATSPTLPGATTGVEASLPLGAAFVDLGGLADGLDLRIALSPGALVDWSDGSASLSGLGRAALYLEGSAFKAGVSGELPFSLSGGAPSPEWPLELAAEARLMLGGTPFVAAAYATAAIYPTTAPSLGFGLGLGLLF